MSTLYIGNLKYEATEDDLRAMVEFSGFEVTRVKICFDRETKQSRGFGFVDITDADPEQAIADLDGRELLGRELRVREATDKPRSQRVPRINDDGAANSDLL